MQSDNVVDSLPDVGDDHYWSIKFHGDFATIKLWHHVGGVFTSEQGSGDFDLPRFPWDDNEVALAKFRAVRAAQEILDRLAAATALTSALGVNVVS